MKRFLFTMLICCAAFLTLASVSLAASETPSSQEEPAALPAAGEPLTPPEAEEVPALPEVQPLASVVEITCQFNCEDGSGFGLNPCPDDTLAECCAYAAPACANHGGLESGICTKGRLGMPCQPL